MGQGFGHCGGNTARDLRKRRKCNNPRRDPAPDLRKRGAVLHSPKTPPDLRKRRKCNNRRRNPAPDLRERGAVLQSPKTPPDLRERRKCNNRRRDAPPTCGDEAGGYEGKKGRGMCAQAASAQLKPLFGLPKMAV